MSDLHSGVWFDSLEKIWFEKLVIQLIQLRLDNSIARDLFSVFRDKQLELLQWFLLVSISNEFHCSEIFASIFQPKLSIQQLSNVIIVAGHDLAEEHVLQCFECFGGVFERVKCFEGFVEIRICCLIVLVFCLENTSHEIDISLECRWAIYWIWACSWSCQWCLGLSKILQWKLNLSFNELALN